MPLLLGTDCIHGALRFGTPVEAADTAHVLNRVIAVLHGVGAEPAVLSHRGGRARVLMRLGAFAFALLALEARRAPGAHAPHAVELHARFFHWVIWFWQRCAWMLWGCCVVLGARMGDVVEWYTGRRVARNETYKMCVRVLDEFVHHVDGLLRTRPFTLVF